jgi:hypothetical protein
VEKRINMEIDQDKILSYLRNVSDKNNDFLNLGLTKTDDLNYYRDLAICFLFVKSIKTFRSLIILLENKKHEDTQILMRSLIENQIVSMWLQLKGDVGFLKFWRYELISKINQHYKSLWRTQKRRDPSEFEYLEAQSDVEDKLKNIDIMIKGIESSFDRNKQEDYDKKGWWAGISTSKMANELTMLSNDSNWTWKHEIPFDVTSQYVHPNLITIGDYIQDVNGVMKPNFTITVDIKDDAMIASWIILDMMENFNQRFNLHSIEILNELKDEFNEVFKEN